uniref:Uncharacterized protein n=1 Tax=Glossina palpalis gambiensis TaxID=67801 RepID=A0A1B0C6G9_9MUSC
MRKIYLINICISVDIGRLILTISLRLTEGAVGTYSLRSRSNVMNFEQPHCFNHSAGKSYFGLASGNIAVVSTPTSEQTLVPPHDTQRTPSMIMPAARGQCFLVFNNYKP